MSNPDNTQLAAERERFLRWRDIEPGDECPRCDGVGWKLYASTATWRGGMGGGQVDHGQQGEYPCPACGLPTTWDPVGANAPAIAVAVGDP